MHIGHKKVCDCLEFDSVLATWCSSLINKTPRQVQPKVRCGKPLLRLRPRRRPVDVRRGACVWKRFGGGPNVMWLESSLILKSVISFVFWFRILVQLILRITDFLLAPHRTRKDLQKGKSLHPLVERELRFPWSFATCCSSSSAREFNLPYRLLYFAD